MKKKTILIEMKPIDAIKETLKSSCFVSLQGCYVQEQPEKFLKSVHKKLLVTYFLFLFSAIL